MCTSLWNRVYAFYNEGAGADRVRLLVLVGFVGFRVGDFVLGLDVGAFYSMINVDGCNGNIATILLIEKSKK